METLSITTASILEALPYRVYSAAMASHLNAAAALERTQGAPGGAEIEAERLATRSLLNGETVAGSLYDDYGDDIHRIVWRTLGADPEHDDLVQHVFMVALANLHRVRRFSSLRAWLRAVTVNTVRTEIRRRKWRKLLHLSDTIDTTTAGVSTDPETHDAVCRFYAVLDLLSAEDRLALTLRLVDGQSLENIASSLGCSLATVKRRLARAERQFVAYANNDPVLGERLQKGARWVP